MINPSTSVHSMVSPGMVPHGVMHPRATMPPMRPTRPIPPLPPTRPMRPMYPTRPMHPIPPIRPMYSTGWGYPRYGGGGGQYGTMPGQYMNQIQMPGPGGMGMNMTQQPALPHMIPSYNPAMGAGVQPFSNLGAAIPQSSLMSLDPTLRTSSEQGVSPQQLTPPPTQQPHTPPPPSTPQLLQTQTWTRPHNPAAHLTPPSTSWLHPQGVIQPGSSTQQVSESLVYVNSFNQGL